MMKTIHQHNNQHSNKHICHLTTKECKVLVVGKEEGGANVPKNGAFNVVLGMTPLVECSRERSVRSDTSREKEHVGFY